MKTVVCFCAMLNCAFAQTPFDWSVIRAAEVFVDPLDTAPVALRGRIVGGTEVTPNSIPYQVALIIDNVRFCGGSLISRDWVLTAAHCTSSASFVRIVLGAHNIRRLEAAQVMLTSSTIINHPQYSRATLSNDISLIRLPFSAPLSSSIQTIGLTSANSGDFARSRARLSGWGRTSDSAPSVSSTLMAVSVTVISNARCQQTYGANVIEPTMLCTSGGGLVGGCQGDSGGPLILNGVQIGVVSFVSSWGCQSGTPTVYTRISSLRNWITLHTGI